MVQALQELPIRNNKFRCSSPVERPRIHIQICKNIFYARPTKKESVSYGFNEQFLLIVSLLQFHISCH
jgi:hypothetical protein